MDTLKKIVALLRFIAIIVLALSFLLMILNVIFYYGFVPSVSHPEGDTRNPLGLTIPLILTIHLTVGFLAGAVFSRKRFLLGGSMGLLCAFLITGISLLYFGWREEINTVEVLVPLTGGIVPVVILNDYIRRKFPVKDA